MSKEKIIALTSILLAISFLAVFYVLSWQEPTQNPPQGNVPAPLNVGPQGQAKEGGLILNTGGATNGLIVQNGNVGIGTTTPSEKLEVNGNIKLSGTTPTYRITNLATLINSSDAATKGYVDAAVAAGGSDSRYVVYGINGCAPGWTAVVTGYTTMYTM